MNALEVEMGDALGFSESRTKEDMESLVTVLSICCLWGDDEVGEDGWRLF